MYCTYTYTHPDKLVLDDCIKNIGKEKKEWNPISLIFYFLFFLISNRNITKRATQYTGSVQEKYIIKKRKKLTRKIIKTNHQWS